MLDKNDEAKVPADNGPSEMDACLRIAKHRFTELHSNEKIGMIVFALTDVSCSKVSDDRYIVAYSLPVKSTSREWVYFKIAVVPQTGESEVLVNRKLLELREEDFGLANPQEIDVRKSPWFRNRTKVTIRWRDGRVGPKEAMAIKRLVPKLDPLPLPDLLEVLSASPEYVVGTLRESEAEALRARVEAAGLLCELEAVGR